MNSMRKKLPIGIQSLAKMTEGGYYYVDKTGLLAQLIEGGQYYFLSRPRRFGKSLLLDTLKELFEGRRALFAGLAIEPDWDWTQKHPVIRISFGGSNLKDVNDLASTLDDQLAEHEEQFSLPRRREGARARLRDLIIRLHQGGGQKVVVLVDEYDKPILDRIDQPEIALAMREALKDVYSVIKDLDAHIRFGFLTGVSKFSKVSLFSGLNNLNDISLDPRYSSLCGYTDADIDTVFAPELAGLDRAEIKRWYNGYNWLGEAVYNPFDVLLLFDKRIFKPWWYESGTPSFLLKILAQKEFFTPDLARLQTSESLISTFDIEQISAEALLFQTGYLTILEVSPRPSGNALFTLGYPNHEVATSLNESLLSCYTDDASKSVRLRNQLDLALQAADLDKVRAAITAFFASIPHAWFDNNPISRYEGYYASVFYSYFAALGYEIRVEDATNHGRIDMSLILPDQIWLFEFKVVELQPQGAALAQLQAKGYAEKYRAHGLPIRLVGVEFAREQRNVVGFEVAQVQV